NRRRAFSSSRSEPQMSGDEVGHGADIVQMKYAQSVRLLAGPVGRDRTHLTRASRQWLPRCATIPSDLNFRTRLTLVSFDHDQVKIDGLAQEPLARHFRITPPRGHQNPAHR